MVVGYNYRTAETSKRINPDSFCTLNYIFVFRPRLYTMSLNLYVFLCIIMGKKVFFYIYSVSTCSGLEARSRKDERRQVQNYRKSCPKEPFLRVFNTKCNNCDTLSLSSSFRGCAKRTMCYYLMRIFNSKFATAQMLRSFYLHCVFIH